MKTYFRYVRGENGRGIGAVEIIADANNFGIGVSMCNPLDTFNKLIARQTCDARANDNINGSPYSYFDMVDNVWFEDINNCLPKSNARKEDVDNIYSTIFEMIDDIVKDYGRYYLESREDVIQIKTLLDNLKLTI